MKILSLVLLYGFVVVVDSDKHTTHQHGNHVSKNGMEVSWEFNGDQIDFEMQAPSLGWITIGFNTQKNMTGCYLLMGRVQNGVVEVVEHYTKSPGNYASITEYGGEVQILPHLSGEEKQESTKIRFSLPQKALGKFQRNLYPDSEYVMVLAYSQEDDFQHHSIMRNSLQVKL